MNNLFTNFKLFIQFSFFKIVIMWARAVQYSIGCLWQWADNHHKELQDRATKLLIEEEHKNDVDDFVKSMQRQAKITGSRPKKGNN